MAPSITVHRNLSTDNSDKQPAPASVAVDDDEGPDQGVDGLDDYKDAGREDRRVGAGAAEGFEPSLGVVVDRDDARPILPDKRVVTIKSLVVRYHSPETCWKGAQNPNLAAVRSCSS